MYVLLTERPKSGKCPMVREAVGFGVPGLGVPGLGVPSLGVPGLSFLGSSAAVFFLLAGGVNVAAGGGFKGVEDAPDRGAADVFLAPEALLGAAGTEPLGVFEPL